MTVQSFPGGEMHLPQVRRPPRTIALHFVVWVLVAVAGAWGLFLVGAGDYVARSSTYTILRTIPGGMRVWGVSLVIGAVLMAWALGRDERGGHPRALNLVLAGGALRCPGPHARYTDTRSESSLSERSG